ncbi:MAG: haloacid dehalogenase [Candidatus Hecatellales archaeon B24]|nr:MAG: haloacid dehalogenase [Candidatus Hecatellales archaeon B24]
MLKKVKAVGFDLDGTLVNNLDQLLEAWKLALENMGVKVKSEMEILRHFGRRTTDIALEFTGSLNAALRLVEAKDGLYDRLWPKHSRLFPGVTEVLAEVKRRGYLCGVASSNKRERIKRILTRFNIISYMDAVVGYDEVEKGKPHPDMLLELARRLRVQPSQMAYVGDSFYDVEMARRAGGVSILIPSGLPYEAQGGNLKAEPDYMVKSIKEILSLLPAEPSK